MIEGNGARPSHQGIGVTESETMYTLNATEVHAVCYAQTQFAQYKEVNPTLRASSGNIRAWREFINATIAGGYFYGDIDPIYRIGLDDSLYIAAPDPRVKRVYYRELYGRSEMLSHMRMSVKFTVDRGVSHEIVRHRLFSFAQESTRYCNYSKDKFGKEITVIRPCFLDDSTAAWRRWVTSMAESESAYFELLNIGLKAEEARAVLPNSLKTELIVTGNLREWQHFFDLRAKMLTGPVHPQMAEVAVPLWECFKALFPGIIE